MTPVPLSDKTRKCINFNRKEPRETDFALYCERNLVERPGGPNLWLLPKYHMESQSLDFPLSRSSIDL